MYPYAQTNIRLFNQLRREGYSYEKLRSVFNAYELAMHLFTGLYRPSGDTFISHLVGTASILASLHARVELVITGLLHAAYAHGDFGITGTGLISDAKRKQVRRVVGDEVEEYVARYTLLRWNTQTIPVLCDGIDTLGPIDKNVILMKLANELEHHLDLELLNYGNTETQRLTQHGHVMVEMAEKLGFPTLAADLAKVFREAVSAEIPEEIRKLTDRERPFGVIRAKGRQESTLIVPKSCSRRLSVLLFQGLNRLRPTVKLRKTLGFRTSAKK